MNSSKISVKAGRYIFDQQTKKVKVSKQKGLLSVYKNQQQEIYFSWTSLDDHIQYVNLMVFPNDTFFQVVPNKKNTYILRMDSNPDKYFFWLQEKVDEQKLVKNINDFINLAYDFEESQSQKMDIQQPNQPKKDQKPSPMDVQSSNKTTNKPAAQADDFIQRMQRNLQAANKNKPKPIKHLGQIVNNSSINQLINEASQNDKKQLSQHLPESMQQTKFLASNLRSPQFLQAIDALTDALNSQNAIALFMELGLDQKFLQKHYGVDAFVRALDDWGKKQPKVEEKKQQKMDIQKPNEKQSKKQ